MNLSNLTFSEFERKLYIENSPVHAILVATIDEISDNFEDHYESGHSDGYDQGYTEGYNAAECELSE